MNKQQLNQNKKKTLVQMIFPNTGKLCTYTITYYILITSPMCYILEDMLIKNLNPHNNIVVYTKISYELTASLYVVVFICRQKRS